MYESWTLPDLMIHSFPAHRDRFIFSASGSHFRNSVLDQFPTFHTSRFSKKTAREWIKKGESRGIRFGMLGLCKFVYWKCWNFQFIFWKIQSNVPLYHVSYSLQVSRGNFSLRYGKKVENFSTFFSTKLEDLSVGFSEIEVLLILS